MFNMLSNFEVAKGKLDKNHVLKSGMTGWPQNDEPFLTPFPIKRSWTYTLARRFYDTAIFTLHYHWDIAGVLLFLLIVHGLLVVPVHPPTGHCHCKPRGVGGHHGQGGQDGKKNLAIHSPLNWVAHILNWNIGHQYHFFDSYAFSY